MRSTFAWLLISICLGFFISSSSSRAADDPPMRVVLIRSNEPRCEPQCTYWIAAQGAITPKTPEAFRRIFKQIGSDRVPVFVNSGGGNVDAAMAIGRMIRARKLDVAIGHTLIAPCSAADKTCSEEAGTGLKGEAVEPGTRCASACTMILAAGTHRIVPYMGRVGVHQIVWLKAKQQGQRPAVLTPANALSFPVGSAYYEKVARYLREMGVGKALDPLMRATPSSSIHWLTQAELRESELATEFYRAQDFVRVANSALRDASGAARVEKRTATGWIRVGEYKGRPITLPLYFSWKHGSRIIELTVAPSSGGEPVPTAELAIVLQRSPDPENVMSAPNGKDAGEFAAVMAHHEFCKAAPHPMLTVKVMSLDVLNVSGGTIETDMGSFDGMTTLLRDVCFAED